MFQKWWFWIGLIIIGVFIWQFWSGWGMSNKLYKMALDNLREDKTTIVDRQRKDLEDKEKIIIDLQKKLDVIQKQRIAAQAESERLKELNREKDIQILALEKERKIIIIPTDPNILADEFRKRGYSPRVVLPD